MPPSSIGLTFLVNFRIRFFCLLPLLLLATLFWGPTLFEGKSIVHGDSIVAGYSLLALQARSFDHLGQLIWADGVYGGHPLFAEGQGAFASPFNMFLAWVHYAFDWLGSRDEFGTLALDDHRRRRRRRPLQKARDQLDRLVLCRHCDRLLGRLDRHSAKCTIYGTLAWIPWTFWAFEEWLSRPAIRSAILLGGATALIILSGYPQAVHGAVIYMALSLATAPSSRRPDVSGGPNGACG